MIRDNTLGNNGGLFINFITLDGVVETDPPNAALTPTTFALARAHLHRLVYAVGLYGYTHDNRTPADLTVFYGGVEGGGLYETARTFWNPGDIDPLPARITNSIPNGFESANVSFDYLTPNVDFFALPADTVVLRDNTPANNLGYGVFSTHADFTSRFTPTCAGEVIRDGRVDMHDLARLQANCGRYDDLVTPADGDIDASGGVFWQDAVLLLPNLGNTCP